MFKQKQKSDDIMSPPVNDKKLQKQQEKDYQKRFRAISSMLDIIPIIDYDDVQECFVTKDGKYIDLIQIMAKDLSNVGRDIINYDTGLFEKLYKIYEHDFKIVFLDYPIDTSNQIKYFKNRIEKTINPVFLQYLNEKISELEYLQKHRNNREFFIMVFSNSKDENYKNINMMKGTLESLVIDIDLEKKIKILQKLNNKNVQVG